MTIATLTPPEIELGRLAIERRLATREQVRQCADLRSSGSTEHLAKLLVTRGFMGEEQARTLFAEVQSRSGSAMGGSGFGSGSGYPGQAGSTNAGSGAYGAPASNFGAPGSAFAQPPSNYGAPQQGYAQPPSGYPNPQGSGFPGGMPPSGYPGQPPSNAQGSGFVAGSGFGVGSGAHGIGSGAHGMGSGAHGMGSGAFGAPQELPSNISPDDPIAHAMTTRKNADGTMETVFGPYDILGEIARGGMGIVYRARQRSLKRIVALKVMKEGENASEKQIRRFKRETEAAAKLQHPNIVAVHEVGCHEAFHYFTMDLIEGDPLDAIVKRKEKMPVRKVLEIVMEVGQAIHYAHGKGIIHRDLKPANILLDTDGHPKVTDFGLAKQIDHKSMLTRTGAVVGTPFYMPPEQAKGDVDIDQRADVYALGVILYELLTLKLPFHGETTMEVYHKILEEDPIHPRKHDSRVDRDVNTIVIKAMEKDVTRRYQTSEALSEDIQRYLDGDPIKARPLGPIGKLYKKAKKNMPVVVVGTVTALALSGALGLIYLRNKQALEVEREINRKHEWDTFVTEVDNQCINARSQISSGMARQKDRDPQGALAELEEAERILDDLPLLAKDFTNWNEKERILGHLDVKTHDIGAIYREIYLQIGRSYAMGGPAQDFGQATDFFQRGLERCVDPSWESEPEDEKEEAARKESVVAVKRDELHLRLEIGKVRALEGDMAKALQTFQEILDADSKHKPARLEMGRVHDMAGDHLKAISCFSDVIEQDSKTLLAYLYRGQTLHALGRCTEALEDFTKVLDLKDDSFEGYIWLGRTQQALGHHGEAQDSLTEAIDITPSLPDGYFHRAKLHFAQRKLPQAIKDYEVAISRSAQFYEAYLGLGQALEWVLDYERASQQYEEILSSSDREAAPIQPRARAALARLNLVRADPYECAMEVEERIRQEGASSDGALGPAPSLAVLGKKTAELRTQRLNASAKGFEAALALETELVPGLLGRARLALAAGELPVARSHAERAVQALAKRPHVRHASKVGKSGGGADGGEWGDEDDGWEDDNSGSKAGPRRGDLELAWAHNLLGVVALKEKDAKKAKRHFKQALSADPGSAMANAGLGHIYEGEGEAIKAADRFAESRTLQLQRSDEAGYFYAEGLRFRGLAMRSKKPEFYKQARQSYARARTANPLHSLAALERARLCGTWSAYDVAVKSAEEAVEVDPYLREGYEHLGFLFTRDLPTERKGKSKRPEFIRDQKRAKAEFDRAVKVASDPADAADACYGRALALLALGAESPGGKGAEAAKADLERSIKAIPADFNEAEPRQINQAIAYLDLYAKVNEQLGDKGAAKEAMDRVDFVKRKAMQAAEAQLKEGQTLRDRLNYSEAIKRFDRAIELNPKFDKAYYDRGTCYLKIGNFVPGILDFSRALELNPRIADQVYNKVYQISYVVDLNRVITELNKIVSDHPSVSYVVFLRGFFYVAKTEFKQVSREDLELGIADFDRCLELNTTHVTALLYRGFLWMKMADKESTKEAKDGCYARARKNYLHALDLDPESGISHYLQALCWSIQSTEEGISEDLVKERKAKSLEELNLSFKSEFKGYERIRNEKGFDAVRNMEEFKKLMRGK
jgi:serine/threonine protein kinase/tetratricopeptide (TPR) repeat protein